VVASALKSKKIIILIFLKGDESPLCYFISIMKKTIILSSIVLLLLTNSYAQNEKQLPQLTIENLKGEQISTSEILNAEGPTIISFWATWCKPCIMELNEMQDLYQDWQDETNVKVIAVSVDDTRSAGIVPAFVSGKSWDFDIYLDKNSDFKRTLNISNVPYTILLDQNGDIVWIQSGYTPGDEEVLYEELVKL